MTGDLLLLRHPPVPAHWAGRCYGRAEAGLAAGGRLVAAGWAAALAGEGFAQVLASPRRRARAPAARLARALGLEPALEPRLAERDFGTWEGQAWDAIWQAEGSAMDGMIDAPATFRPGGGETTAELAARALAWFGARPPGPLVVVAHGGPIAAILGTLAGEAPRDWLARVPRPGEGAWIRGGVATPWPVRR